MLSDYFVDRVRVWYLRAMITTCSLITALTTNKQHSDLLNEDINAADIDLLDDTKSLILILLILLVFF